MARLTKEERERRDAALSELFARAVRAGPEGAADLLRETLMKIEALKTAYDELDKLTEALQFFGIRPGDDVSTSDGKHTYLLKDNFSETNVVFRPAGVRRFEFVEVKD